MKRNHWFVLLTVLFFGLSAVGLLTAADMSGTYYIGAPGTAPGGANPDFASLKAACDSLNKATFSGNVLMYFTSNLVEPANVCLGINPGNFTVTFKPYPGTNDTIKFTQTTDNSGPSGAWVFGTRSLASWDSLVTTRNIIVDGSNIESGTTRNLVITTASTAHGNANPIRLAGDVNNSIFKNLIIYPQQSVTYAFLITHRYSSTSAKYFTPDSITVENCDITNVISGSGQTLAISNSGTFTTTMPSMKNIVFRYNKLTARTRGIFLNYAGSTDVYGNDITVNQTSTGLISTGIFGCTITNATDVTNIYNNKITLLATANSNSGDYGVRGIEPSSRGTYNIYNNIITGFATTTTTANPNCKIYGISCASAAVTANVYHNTIRMNNLSIVPGTGTVLYAGVYIKDGTNNLYNNIVVNEEDDFKTYAIYRYGTSGTLNADYNDYYLAGTTNAKVGFFTSDAATLADWQTASGQDAHSVSRAVNFVGPTDLHLTGLSLGDFALAGTPLAAVTTDIDGDARSLTYPYMGADEGAVALVPPTKPEFRKLALISSGDAKNWRPVKGDLVAGYKLPLLPALSKMYLTVGPTTETNIALKPGYYGFNVTGHPDGFFEFWAARNVTADSPAGTPEALIWKIINGNAPAFYLKVDATGMMALIDGFTYQKDTVDAFYQVETDYVPGAYAFTGKVASDETESENIVVNLTLKGLNDILTIAELQDTTGCGGSADTPFKGKWIKTYGIVTGVAPAAFFIQDGVGPWNGVYAYTKTAPGVAIGDSVEVRGKMAEYYNVTEIDSATATVIASGKPLPEPVVVTAAEFKQEKYEGVLVKLENVTCTNPSLGYGEWELTDATGTTRADDLFYAFAARQNWVYTVTGICHFANSNFKIEPRNANDIIIVSQPASRFVWEKDIMSYPFFKNDHKTRGMAYNPVTNHLLVASRTDGDNIWIINAANGDTVGRLNMTGVTGGTFAINIPRVTKDGVIYVCNLSTGSSAPFKIYRWENETAAPTVAYENSAPSARIGDSFALKGAGVNTILYASGSTSTSISVFTTTDGANFTAGTPIPVAAGLARGGIAPVEDGTFWVNGAGTATTHINADGSVIAAAVGSMLDVSWHNVTYFHLPFSKKLIAVVGRNTTFRGNQVQVWNIHTSETNPVFVDTVNLTSTYNANTNATGDLAIKDNGDGTVTIFELITNNGIAAWKLTLPVDIPLMPIAEAKQDKDGNFRPDLEGRRIAVRGVITTTDFESLNPGRWNVFIQDSTGGINIYTSKFKGPVTIGDEIELHGILTFYNGLTEIVPDSLSHVKVLSHGNVVAPRKVKLADIGEETESILVQVDSIWFVQPVAWPAAGNNANLLVTDGIDTVTFRIDKDSDVDDWTDWPKGLFGVIAVGNQYTSKVPPDNGYQIQAISKDLFYTYPEPFKPKPLVPFWARTQDAGNFPAYMSTNNLTRGMAYGKVDGKDRLYVVTRSGDHRIVVYNALTGDSVTAIPAPANPVGLFPVNAVDVSDDGIIFVSNMTLDASTAPFTVYRYDNEAATPVVVISYNGFNGRFGDMFSVYGSAADNSLTIYAAASKTDKIIKFTTADHGATFTPTEITIPRTLGTLPNVAQSADGTLWIKSAWKPLMHLKADGTLDTVATDIVGNGSSKIKYFRYKDKDQLLVYYYNSAADAGMEKFHIVDVTEGAAKAKIIAFCNSIGNVANINGTGSVDVMPVTEDVFVAFIMGTNNGLAAFTNSPNFMPANVLTKFYGTTPNLLANPYGAGYICGTNAYGDIGKYQRFDLNPNFENFLYGFIAQFGVMEIVGEPDTLDMVVRAIGAQGEPGNLLFFMKVPTSQIDTSALGIHNVYRLLSPIPVPPSFFIGFEWPTTANDVFAIYSDKNGEGDGANRVWERFNDGSFNDFGTVLNPNFSWNIDVDLWISALYIQGPEVGIKEAGEAIPTKYALYQNYPNPFNPTTNIRLDLPENAKVKLMIYNILGQEVLTVYKGHLPQGSHIFSINAANLASGVYFYRVEANKFSALKKMMIIK